MQSDTRTAQKAELRSAALARRDALPPDMRAAAAEAIADRGLPVPVRAGDVVAGYMPIRSETSPLPLMRRYVEAGARLALPRIVGRGHALRLHAWTIGEPLVRGQWNIREPDPSAPEVDPDLVLVPLAAFDRRGFRIGYGAGYYDKTMAALRARKRIVAVGLAYAVQEIEAVPNLPHDARLDFIATERELIGCRRT